MKTEILSKENTLVIKAIGVMLLVIYHLLRTPDILSSYSLNYFPFQTNVLYNVLEYGYFCVGIFLFLTMFGMTRQMMRMKNELTSKGYFWFVVRRYVKLILFFAPIYITSILLFMRERPLLSVYGGGKKMAFYMFLDMLGLSQSFRTPTYNLTWWFLQLAIWAIILFPILYFLQNKISYLILPFAILIPYIIPINGYVNQNIHGYILTLCMGVCFAKEHVLERMKAKKIVKNNILNKGIKLIIWSICFVPFAFVLSINSLLHPNIRFFMESFIVFFLIYFIYEFICGVKWLEVILKPIGKHSATIFYVHSFLFLLIPSIRDVLFKLEYLVFIYIAVILISIIYSILLEHIKKIIRYHKMASKVIGFCERKMVEVKSQL